MENGQEYGKRSRRNKIVKTLKNVNIVAIELLYLAFKSFENTKTNYIMPWKTRN